jgi:5-methylthioadenosine/S-adenosylhomocysteine deaminase
MKLLISNCSVLDRSNVSGIKCGMDVLIVGNVIQTVATHDGLRDDSDTRVIDGEFLLAIPGLINAHSHSPEMLGRASHDRLPLEPWLEYMVNAMGVYSPRDHYLSAMLGAIETLKFGATSILDHLTLPGGCSNEVIDAVMQAYADAGIRAMVAPVLPDPTGETFDNELARRFQFGVVGQKPEFPSLKEEEAILRAFHAKWEGACGGRLRTAVGPGGIQWCSAKFLHACFDWARELDMGVHSHLMETRVQDETVRSMYGMTAVEFLSREGLLEPRLSLPHSVWLTDRDVRMIAESGAVPVHNPAANMRLGSGYSPIKDFMGAGCIPALGADGAMSSDHQNMFVVMHLAAQIHNSFTDGYDPERWPSSREVFDMATLGGTRALRMESSLGKIEEGRLADITLLNLNTSALCPMNNAFHSLAYTAPSGSVRHVIANGKVVVQDGKMTTIDENAVYAECREAAAKHHFSDGIPKDAGREVARMLRARNELYASTSFVNKF